VERGKILTQETINSILFDSDTKLAATCRWNLCPFERILAVPDSSASVKRVFSKSG